MQDARPAASFFKSDHMRGQAGWPTVDVEMPAIPDPVPTRLAAQSTAILISDLTYKILNGHAQRAAHIPAVAATLLARARQAGLTVVYSARAEHASDWLQDLAPAAGDVFVASNGQDRFHASELDQVLRSRNIETVLLVGWKISGSLLYTAVSANLRGYTAVVPVDTTSAPNDFEVAAGMYQMLNQFHANAMNEPCKPRCVTLTRSDLTNFV